MVNRTDYPDDGSFVICEVTRINPNSVEVSLKEHPGVSGMVHVSELANTWIRDIRKIVKMGQVIVCKVLFVDRYTGILTLSIKRVNTNQKRDKISEWKNEKKAENFLRLAAKSLGKTPEAAIKEAGDPMKKAFGTMYSGFESASKNGPEELLSAGIDKKWVSALEEIAKKSIKIREISVKGTLMLHSFSPDGVSAIRKVMSVDDPHITIKYISAPEYSITVTGKDYLLCEKKLAQTTEKIISEFRKLSGGEAEFIRKAKAGS